MRRKSKGVNRLGLVCGCATSLYFLNIAFNSSGAGDSIVGGLIFFAASMVIGLIVGWGIIKVAYWVYCGFKEDRESK
jgi:hypothetical protein